MTFAKHTADGCERIDQPLRRTGKAFQVEIGEFNAFGSLSFGQVRWRSVSAREENERCCSRGRSRVPLERANENVQRPLLALPPRMIRAIIFVERIEPFGQASLENHATGIEPGGHRLAGQHAEAEVELEQKAGLLVILLLRTSPTPLSPRVANNNRIT